MNELDREAFEKWLQESNAKEELLLKHGVSHEKVTEVLKLHALDGIRQSLDELNNQQDCIADELVRIQSSMEILERLSDCIASSCNGNQFCITGDVTAYEP